MSLLLILPPTSERAFLFVAAGATLHFTGKGRFPHFAQDTVSKSDGIFDACRPVDRARSEKRESTRATSPCRSMPLAGHKLRAE
jgi:hypothetical protein